MNASTVPLDRDALRLAAETPATQRGHETEPLLARPQLRLVPRPNPARRRRSPLAGALTAVGVVLGVLCAQLGLSIAVSEGAYEARALQLELRDLTRVERVLSQNADKLASPQNLAENAMRLGMVQNVTPATLRLSDNAVLGTVTGGTATLAGNLVPNSALEGLPVVDADGLLVDRSLEQAAAAAAAKVMTAVTWDGPLPAPQTQ